MNANTSTNIASLNAQGSLPAQVITRWADGCHIRIADTLDEIMPPTSVPADADKFRVRIQQGGLVILAA